MAGRSSEFPTLFEILSTVSVGKSSRMKVTDGRRIESFPRREGVQMLSPNQMLGVRVPVQRVTDGVIRGYQQHLRPAKTREIARFLDEFSDVSYVKVLPVIEISIDSDHAYYTDGQNRAAGAIIADKPMRVLVTKRSAEEARKLFALQKKATPPNRNVLILDSDEPVDEYIQDAVTSENKPWSALVTSSLYGPTKNRMSASTVRNVLTVYLGLYSTGAEVDEEAADGLAALVSAFGTKQLNPMAFRSKSLHAIAIAAKAIFRSRVPHPRDRDRWATQMPKFNFATVAYMPAKEIALRLVMHWNSGLPTDSERRVTL